MKSFIFFLVFMVACPLTAQTTEGNSPIIFIYDASGSMWGQINGQAKKDIAADVLTAAVNNLSDDQKLGFVAYGHRTKGDCNDVEFMVDVEHGTKAQVNASIRTIKPLGKTPLAHSALQVINKLRQSKVKATIILVTDGIESCGGNICDVIKAAKEEGIDFKLHIIGFGLQDEDTEQLKCAAEAGDGQYYTAEDADGLSEVLDAATVTTIDKPEANFSIYALKNGEAIDAYAKAYDLVNEDKHFAVRTYKDTGFLYLPPGTYRFEVHPLGGSDVDKLSLSGIESFDDKMGHQTFSFDGGIIQVTTTNNGKNWDCVVKVLNQDDKVVAATRTYTKPKEIEVNPGIYNVWIQALIMEGMATKTEITQVEIKAGETTPVEYDFKTGNFELFTRVDEENIDAVVKIKDIASGKVVAGSRTYDRGTKFLLNPGAYEVKAVPLGVHKGKATQVINIEVKQGESTTKELSF